MESIATKYADRLDALLIGHAHATVEEAIAGVPVLEPANNGQYVGKLVFEVENKDGKWVVNNAATKATLLDTSTVTPNAAFLAAFKDLDTKSRNLAGKKWGKLEKPLGIQLKSFPESQRPLCRIIPSQILSISSK